jgi:hypothetical protein
MTWQALCVRPYSLERMRRAFGVGLMQYGMIRGTKAKKP